MSNSKAQHSNSILRDKNPISSISNRVEQNGNSSQILQYLNPPLPDSSLTEFSSFHIQQEEPLCSTPVVVKEQRIIPDDYSSKRRNAIKDLFPFNLTYRFNWLSRLFLIHILSYMKKVKNQVIDQDEYFTEIHLPKMRKEDKVDHYFFKTQEILQKKKKPLTELDIAVSIFFGSMLKETMLIIFCFLVENLGKCCLSIFMSQLITAIIDREMKKAYILGIVLGGILLFVKVGKHQGLQEHLICINIVSYLSMEFKNYLRLILTNMVFWKISQLSNFTMQHLDVGKVLNVVSSDLNQIEQYFSALFSLFVFPISLGFGSWILWNRFNGPIGLLIIGLLGIVYPFQIMIQNRIYKSLKLQKIHSDERLSVVNELLTGIKSVKMLTLENVFFDLIKQFRLREVKDYLMILVYFSIDRAISFSIEINISNLFFIILYSSGLSELDVASMMSTIQLAQFFRLNCIVLVSQALTCMLNVRIAISRVLEIVNLSNQQMEKIQVKSEDKVFNSKQSNYGEDGYLQKVESIQSDESKGLNNQQSIKSFKINVQPSDEYDLIRMDDFSIYYNHLNPVLSNINLTIREGTIVAVIGGVGSGKSALLNSIVMEIPKYSGNIYWNGVEFSPEHFTDLEKRFGGLKIAYVEQEHSIFQGTFRSNVLYGKPYNPELYRKILEVCCLEQDIEQMKEGDMTSINSGSLSGGQKTRVCLARSLYQLADIYLFDNILADLDSNVAELIFKKAMQFFILGGQNEFSKKKKKPIVLLVTNQEKFAAQCHQTLLLQEGRVKIYQQSQFQRSDEVTSVFSVHSRRKSVQKGSIEAPQINSQSHQRFFMKRKQSSRRGKDDIFKSLNDQIASKNKSQKRQSSMNVKMEQIDYTSKKKGIMWVKFFKFWNLILLAVILIMNICTEILNNAFYMIVARYDQFTDKPAIFGIMSGIAISIFINNIVKYILNAYTSLQANNEIVYNMVKSLSSVPIKYYDDPHKSNAYFLNRFSNDLSILDLKNTYTLYDIWELGAFFLFSVLVLCIIQPVFIGPVACIFLANYMIYHFCDQIINQSQKCELVQRTPVLDMIKKMALNPIQIRLQSEEQMYRDKFLQITNVFLNASLIYKYTQRAFAYAIDLFGLIASNVGIFLIISMNSDDTAAFVQALLLLLTFNDSQQQCLKEVTRFQANMNSFQRMSQLLNLEKEQEPTTSKKVLSRSMTIKRLGQPKLLSSGSIEFHRIGLKYTTNLILKFISFNIKSGEKIGVVGRSGSGKSTIAQALFRLREFEEQDGSRLLIDGKDIKNFDLIELRKNIGFIPQSPFTFHGTVRKNIDPFNEFKDEELKKVLEKINVDIDLQAEIQKCNLTLGQKQTLNVARFLLRKTQILVLDEFTAQVDFQTENLLLNILKTEFKDTTIIAIAHRLITIADYDKVLVLENGRLVEQGIPFSLLCINPDENAEKIDRSSLFAQLVSQNLPHEVQQIFDIAKEKYLSQQDHSLQSSSSQSSSQRSEY